MARLGCGSPPPAISFSTVNRASEDRRSRHSLTVAVAQTAARLGNLRENLGDTLRLTASARDRGAGLVLFPELALTGYSLQDAVAATALRPHDDDPWLGELVGSIGETAVVVGFVEEGLNGAFYNSALVAYAGRIVAVHRKRDLPTYGLFDEARFFKPGTGPTLFELAGWRFGLLICEEAWYPARVQELVEAGAEALLILSAGPGRGVEAGERWQTQDAWRDLVRYYARTYTLPALLANRTGIEEGLLFGGCSAIFSPSGRLMTEAPIFEEALLTAELSRSSLRRARMRNPGRPLPPPPPFDPLLFPPAATHAAT
jgi:predicted amidohydrolase